jgi:tetratricopeptide (TPR) repeat protein
MLNKKKLEGACLGLDKFIGTLLVTIVFCIVFVLAHRAIFDLDIWLHLASGKLILQNGSVPIQDIFSFTVSGTPWVDHSWFFQIIAYFVYAHWQAGGLILLQSLVVTLTFFILFLIGHKSSGSNFVTAVFLLITAFAALGRFNIRPDIFSMLFFSAYLYLLRFCSDKKALWLLLPVQLLWVNMHGYFILGPVLIFFFIVAEFFRRKVKFLPLPWRQEFALSNPAYARLKVVFFSTILAGLFNPQGAKGALYPLNLCKEVLTGGNKIFFKYIQELQPTFAVYSFWADYYNIMLSLCFLLLLINFKKIRMVDLILAVFFFFFGLTIRNSVFFVLVAFLIAVTYIGATLKRFFSRVEIRVAGKKILFYALKNSAQIIFIAFLISRLDVLLTRSYFDFQKKQLQSVLIGIDENNYPRQAVQFILENKIGPNIFNDFNSGAYIVGNAWPRINVFIDGRTEVYGPQFFSQYQRIISGDILAFEKAVNQYSLDAVLLSMAFTAAPNLAAPLYRSPDWKLVYLDAYAAVFLKNVPKNKKLIERYFIDLNKYTVNPIEIKDLGAKFIYPKPYIQLAKFFDLLKADEAVLQECREALRIMPNCAEAYTLRGKAYLRKKLYPEALDSLRAASVLMPSPGTLVDLGYCFKELKEYKLAAEILDKALRINKKYAPAYYHLGRLNLELKNTTAAIDALVKAVNYDPEVSSYHLWLAKAYLATAEKTKAILDFNKARLELGKAAQYNIEQEESLSRKIKETNISLAF